MSDTNEKFKALPWGNCKPYNGVSVFYRGDTIDAVTGAGAGVLLTKNIINNPKTWTIGHHAARYSFDWLEQIKNNVDAWIDAELKKLEEKERAEAAKVWPPVPPDGYRMCSREEAESDSVQAKRYCKNSRWHELIDCQNVICPLSEFYCTSAPRKFVRCTAQDAVKLSRLGAYVENAEDGCERIWRRIEIAPVTTSLRGCVYRVDKYTVPTGFCLELVIPTVKLPDGTEWDLAMLVGFQAQGRIR